MKRPARTGGVARRKAQRGILLTEMLVYISVIMVVIGVGYVALYRSINNSLALRRSAEDIAKALSTGELWRSDVRAAAHLRLEASADEGDIVWMEGATATNAWRHTGTSAMRKSGSGPWVIVLPNAKRFAMEPDVRGEITAWKLETELQVRTKNPRVRPLFTFLAVPEISPLK